MKRQRGATRVRLIDGVLVAAVALLALKVLGVLSWLTAEPPAAGDLPAFARVLAHARTNYEPQDVATTGSVEKPKEDAPVDKAAVKVSVSPAPRGTEPTTKPPAEGVILERLGERREDLRRKDRDIEMRERLIEESERRLEIRAGELKALQDKVEPGSEKKAETEAVGLKNIVTMYESMKPKEAARVFDRLPANVLVAVVLQMNPRKMAEVLAAMSPSGAEKLTVALATRGQSGVAADPQAAILPSGELPSIEPAPRR